MKTPDYLRSSSVLFPTPRYRFTSFPAYAIGSIVIQRPRFGWYIVVLLLRKFRRLAKLCPGKIDPESIWQICWGLSRVAAEWVPPTPVQLGFIQQTFCDGQADDLMFRRSRQLLKLTGR
jgi:hypothetical protein